MAVNDIYKTVSTQTFGVFQVSNVWHYRLISDAGTDPNDPSFTLNEIFRTVLLPQLAIVVSDNSFFSQLETVCYRLPLDANSQAVNVVGLRVGQTMPPFVSVGIRSQRPGPGFRRGYKRIGGISESDIELNNLVVTYAALWPGVLNNLSLNRTLAGRVFEPTVATGVKTLGTAVTGYRTGNWSLQPSPVTSQVSRKA